MAFLARQKWYIGSTRWAAATAWSAAETVAVGTLRRQLAAPTAGNERVFVCTVAGTTGGTEPTWVITQGAKTTDNTVTWMEVTGKAAVNGAAAEASDWNSAKGTSVSPGVVIKNVAGTHYFVATQTASAAAGTGTEPSFSTTTGATTTDGSVTWTCLGAVGSFAAWGAACARSNLFAGASKFAATSDTAWMSHNSAESWSADPAFSTGVGSLVCVDDGAAPPTTLAYTGSITTTGATSLSLASGFGRGIVLNVGSGAVSASLNLGASSGALLRRCKVNLLGTAGGNVNLAGGSGGGAELEECDVTFNSTASKIVFGAQRNNISGGTVCATGTVPTVLITPGGQAKMRGVDLSNVNTTLSSQNTVGDTTLENCKTHASLVPMTQPTNGPNTARLRLLNCDGGATNYKYYYNGFDAIAVHETTVVRAGGYTDGVTPLAIGVTTSANCGPQAPFTSEDMVWYDDTPGTAKTATLYLTTDTALLDTEAFLRLEYPANGGSPLSGFATTRAVLSPAALATDTSTWAGAAKTYRYKIALAYTPALKGVVRLRFGLLKPSAVVYYDPLPAVS